MFEVVRNNEVNQTIDFNKYQDFESFCRDNGCYDNCPLEYEQTDCESVFYGMLDRFKGVI